MTLGHKPLFHTKPSQWSPSISCLQWYHCNLMEQALELHSQTTTRRNHKQEKKHQRILHQRKELWSGLCSIRIQMSQVNFSYFLGTNCICNFTFRKVIESCTPLISQTRAFRHWVINFFYYILRQKSKALRHIAKKWMKARKQMKKGKNGAELVKFITPTTPSLLLPKNLKMWSIHTTR